MTAAAKATVEARDLKAELKAAKAALAAAEAAAEVLAGEEETALASDEAWSSLERRKRLADREIDRRRQTISALEIAVDDALAARELAEFERIYAAVKGRNLDLRERFAVFRQQVLPEILRLVVDLAKDEDDVRYVNQRVTRDRVIRGVDFEMRSRPAINQEVLNSQVVELWTINDGQILQNQKVVQFDDNGQAYALAPNRSKYWCQRRMFRRVERSYFRPAKDAPPLWKSLEIPSLDQGGQPVYSGKAAMSSRQAIALLEAAVEQLRAPFEPPYVATSIAYEPLDQPIGAFTKSDVSSSPPLIVEEKASTWVPRADGDD